MRKLFELIKSKKFERITFTNNDVIEFIENIKNNEHCILMFSKESFRNDIVNQYLHPSNHHVTAACFTHDLQKYNCDQKITYKQLVKNNILQSDLIGDFLVDVLETVLGKVT